MPNSTSNQKSEQTKLRSTVFFLVIDFSRKLILTEQKKGPIGKFGLIGGGVESGESFEQACIREIYEETETEISIQEENLIFLTDIQFKTTEFNADAQAWHGKEGKVFLVKYDSNLFQGTPEKLDGIPHGEIAWIDYEEFFNHNNDVSIDLIKPYLKS